MYTPEKHTNTPISCCGVFEERDNTAILGDHKLSGTPDQPTSSHKIETTPFLNNRASNPRKSLHFRRAPAQDSAMMVSSGFGSSPPSAFTAWPKQPWSTLLTQTPIAYIHTEPYTCMYIRMLVAPLSTLGPWPTWAT